MAVTSPPRPPRTSPPGHHPSDASPRQTADPGQLRVHWDRVAIFAMVLALIIILVIVVITGATTDDPKTEEVAAAEPTAQPSAAVSSPAPSVAPQACPTPATQPIYEAPAVAGGDLAAPTVALTFDDGPSEFTTEVLDILREKQVRATFFVLGAKVAEEPEILQAVVAAGHMVGNHTWSHHMPNPSVGWKARSLTREIARAGEAIVDATGQEACLFRPPGGIVKGAEKISRNANLSMVMWSVDTRDWAGQRAGHLGFAQAIRTRARQGLKEEHPLVLLHDGGGGYRGSTVAALPGIIDDYRAAGYQFVDMAGHI